MQKKIRIIFAGTSDFAVSSLKLLINNNNFIIDCVITQPDKKVGRGQKEMYSPVKSVAIENNIKLIQPDNIAQTEKVIKELCPDLIIVVSYGQLIPSEILSIPKYGCLNVHASLLPKYRGASVIQAPILNRDKGTGVSIIKMEKGLDSGPIVAQTKLSLKGDENFEFLHDRLADIGAELLISIIDDFVSGRLKLKEQNKNAVSYVSIIKKEDGKIDWNNSAEKIEAMTRAFNPWPGTFTNLGGKILKIKKVGSNILDIDDYKIGELFNYKDGLAVQCGKSALEILKLQLEGKREITAEEFLRGYRDSIGVILK